MKKYKYSKKDRHQNKINPLMLGSMSSREERYHGRKISDLEEAEFIQYSIEKAAKSRYGVLKLDDFSLTRIPEEIFEIRNLRILDLSYNHINDLPEEIRKLTKLKTLILKNNALSALPNSIRTLNKLEKLIIGGNPLGDKDQHFFLPPNIKELHLTNAKISSIPEEIFHLKKLRLLWLAGNGVKEIPPQIGQLQSLKKLYLNYNYLNELPEELYHLPNLEGIFLEGNPMREVPIYDWTGNRLKDWKNYYVEILKGNTKNYKAKVIFLGKGEVGKSTLMKRLEDPQISKEELKEIKQTDGIHIRPLKGIEVQDGSSISITYNFEINMWDFGGQEIQQNVHQFFLTENALFLLLWTVRNAQNKYHYFREWLNTIETYSGQDSRVILIQNKAYGEGSNMEHIDRYSLQKVFPQLKQFKDISALEDINLTGKTGLLSLIKSELLKLPKVGETIPASWERIMEKLVEKREGGTNVIHRKEFEKVCQEFQISNPESIDQIITWLHEIGTILYYPKPRPLNKTIILNPEWITTSVYKILLDNDHKIRENGGKFNGGYLERMLDDDYEQTIIDLMQKFDLCFRLNDEGNEEEEYIVPTLLPAEKPKELSSIQFGPSYIKYEYVYSIMPKGTIGRFISRAYNDRLVFQNSYWQNGVFLKYRENTNALVEFIFASDAINDTIQIKIEGKDKWLLLEKIKDHFKIINQKARLTAEYTFCTNAIECKNDNPSRFDISVLKRMKEQEVKEVQCPQCFKMIPVLKLFEEFHQKRAKSIDDIRAILRNAKIGEALKMIEEHFERHLDDQLQNTFIMIQADFKTFQQEETTPKIDKNSLDNHRNRVMDSTLRLLNSIEDILNQKQK